MHAAVLQLAPILGAEKSKVPFYVAGGVLVAWALVVSLGMGMRVEGFPRTAAAQRGVIAVTAVLVVAAVSTAVLTSGGSATKPATSAATPTATTGTPVPPSSSAGGGSSLRLAANPEGQLSYDTKQLSAKAGRVTITMTNTSPLAHNMTLAHAGTVVGATPTFQGGSKTLTLSLKAGTYKFYCSVPGHRQGGMEGTLTVS